MTRQGYGIEIAKFNDCPNQNSLNLSLTKAKPNLAIIKSLRGMRWIIILLLHYKFLQSIIHLNSNDPGSGLGGDGGPKIVYKVLCTNKTL